jgi:hypothetical protein
MRQFAPGAAGEEALRTPASLPPGVPPASVALREVGSVEVENGEEGGVHPPLLLGAEPAGQIPEALDVHRPDLLDEHPSALPIDLDLGSEGRRPGPPRGRSNENHRPGQESIGLDDYPEPSPVLFVPNTLRQPQSKDVTPPHAVAP